MDEVIRALEGLAARFVAVDASRERDLRKLFVELSNVARAEGAPPTAREAVEVLTRALAGPPDQRAAAVDRVAVLLAGSSESAALGAQPTSSPGNTPGAQDMEIVSEFIVESRQNLGDAEAALLQLEAQPDDKEAIGCVFRAFHTIKGVAALLGFSGIAAFAHAAEGLLSKIRSGEVRCTPHNATLALRAIDALRICVAQVEVAMSDNAPIALPDGLDELASALDRPELGPGGASDGTSVPRASRPASASSSGAPPSCGPEVATVSSASASVPVPMPASPPPAVLHGAKSPAEAGAAVLAALADLSPKDVPAREAVGGRPPGRADTESSWMRVRTDRLDRLIDMVGELVIAQSMVSQDQVLAQPSHEEFRKKVAHGAKIVRELQELSMSLRMVPLKPTFQRLTRVVRDVVQRTGKDVRFVTDGDETEIDRNMVDVIADPLVHMVRNAVDHGVEDREARLAAGKPAQGTVSLAAFHAGGHLVIRLSDDGAGMDRRAIAAKAIARGVIRTESGMTDDEILSLIFEPGFSMRDAVTDISGRGVGMDVVKRGVEALKGRIETSSELGRGSTFTIHVPLTLAITDGMLVRVGRERFILPTVSIRTSFRPSAAMLSRVAGRGEFVRVRDEFVSVYRLHHMFDIDGAEHDPTRALIVVVDCGEGRSAFLVDELLNQQQVVSKALVSSLLCVPGVAGGAILGDGRVGLILDPSGLAALGRQTTGWVAAA